MRSNEFYIKQANKNFRFENSNGKEIEVGFWKCEQNGEITISIQNEETCENVDIGNLEDVKKLYKILGAAIKYK